MNREGAVRARSDKKAVIVAQALVDRIVDEGLGAGAKLPSETDMATAHGVGRGTLREALRLLESQGVVTIRTGPGGGPSVRAPSSDPMAANLALYLQLSGGTFRDVMAVRQVIEPEIAAYAAAHAPEVATELAWLADRDDHHDGVDGFVATAADFHDAVAVCTGNPLFEAILRALHRISEPVAQRIDYSGERRAQLHESHRAIAAAIAAGDPDAARAGMRLDLDQFVEHAEESVPNHLDDVITWRFMG